MTNTYPTPAPARIYQLPALGFSIHEMHGYDDSTWNDDAYAWLNSKTDALNVAKDWNGAGTPRYGVLNRAVWDWV